MGPGSVWSVLQISPKTAFSPGPGLGLFQFRRMLFALAGAPFSFQPLMDKVCWGVLLSMFNLMTSSFIMPLPETMKNTYVWCFKDWQLQVSPCVGRSVALGCPESPIWGMSSAGHGT